MTRLPPQRIPLRREKEEVTAVWAIKRSSKDDGVVDDEEKGVWYRHHPSETNQLSDKENVSAPRENLISTWSTRAPRDGRHEKYGSDDERLFLLVPRFWTIPRQEVHSCSKRLEDGGCCG